MPGPPRKRGTFADCAVPISASQFLVIGGFKDTTQVEEYDTATGEWTSWPQLTVGRRAHSCSLIGQTVVIAGGRSDNDKIMWSTTLLDISSRSERPGGNMTLGRAYFQLLNHEDKLLAIGGEMDKNGLNSVEEWDPTEEVWTPREDLAITIPRAFFGAVSAPRSAVCDGNQ